MMDNEPIDLFMDNRAGIDVAFRPIVLVVIVFICSGSVPRVHQACLRVDFVIALRSLLLWVEEWPLAIFVAGTL